MDTQLFDVSRPCVLEVRNLCKRYGKDEQAVNALLGVNLRLRSGEILGVLGPNGAGKTTLVEILEGLRVADSGEATVFGKPVGHSAAMKQVRDRIGISLQSSVLPPLLTVEEVLSLQHELYPRSRSMNDLIDALGLRDKCSSAIRHLSGGQQQRVAVALALIGDPELMFLDEPTSQLDPQARRAVWQVLEDQRNRRDAAILLTTHQMEEAQRICDRVLIMDHGQVLAEGSPSALIARYCPQSNLNFTIISGAEPSFSGTEANVQILEHGKKRFSVYSDDVFGMIAELLSRQARRELALEDIQVERRSLEDVFLELTGREIRS